MKHAPAAAILCAILAGTPATEAQIVSIGTNPQGTMAFAVGAAIGKVASDGATFQIRVQPNAGPNVSIPQIVAGELDAVLVNMTVSAFAYTGTGDFNGRKMQDVRLATAFFPLRLGMFVKKDSGLRTVKDLKGKRVTTEFPTQINSHLMVVGLLEAAGLTLADVIGVPAPHVARGADDFAAGRVDAAFFSLGAGRVNEINASVGGIRFLTMDDTPAARAAIERHVPGTYITRVEPRPVFTGILEPTSVLATDLVLLVGTKTAAETVYRLVKAIHANKETMAAAAPPLREFEPGHMVRKSVVPFHDGAIRLYREVNQWPPKD